MTHSAATWMLWMALVSVSAAPALAAESPQAGLEAAWRTPDGPLQPLRRHGAALDGYLSAERLPDNAWVVDVAFDLAGQRMRVPVKLNDDFEVIWTPVPAYLDAVAGLVKSGALPKVEGQAWQARTRLPAFGVVVTGKRVVTPYGEISFASALKVEPIDEVMKHTARWVQDTLAGDPAPASFDVLADGDLAWIDVLRVVYSISMQGLFEMHMVALGASSLNAITGLSPVVMGNMPEARGILALAVSAETQGLAFRGVLHGELLPPQPSSCANEATFCANDSATFRAALADVPHQREVLAPAFGIPYRTVVEIATWPTSPPVLSILAP